MDYRALSSDILCQNSASPSASLWRPKEEPECGGGCYPTCPGRSVRTQHPGTYPITLASFAHRNYFIVRVRFSALFLFSRFYVFPKFSLFFSAISISLFTVLQFRAVPVTFILVSKKLVNSFVLPNPFGQ
jgi:hypothetical protein